MAQKKKYPDTVYVPNMVIMFDNVTSLLQGVFLEVLSNKLVIRMLNLMPVCILVVGDVRQRGFLAPRDSLEVFQSNFPHLILP